MKIKKKNNTMCLACSGTTGHHRRTMTSATMGVIITIRLPLPFSEGHPLILPVEMIPTLL